MLLDNARKFYSRITVAVPKNDLAARVGSSYLAVDGVEKFCYNTFEKFGE